MENLPPENPPIHKRRPRYSGTHPRAFSQKYKELNPLKYPETIEKVISSGKTPAGSHRPIMIEEIMAFLNPQVGQTAVDCTLGYGGHALEILKRILPGGLLIGLDADPLELSKTAERLSRYVIERPIHATSANDSPVGPDVKESFIAVHSNFAGLARILAEKQSNGADIVLADLGISSMQLDNPERGFSYKLDGPLDLRLNPNKGKPASEWLATMDVERLSAILSENADENHADLLARAILEEQRKSPITTTRTLGRVIDRALRILPRQTREREGDAPIRRIFQAMRIMVNDEFAALENFLRVLPDCLKPNGKVAILTFHSGEDRRVKKAFELGLNNQLYGQISQEITRPSVEERHDNPRSTSAKMRWAIRM